ncbi:MAG: polysaccharide deacetylase, partial [bacterium]
MKSIMYHYVRGEEDRPPDYYYLDVSDFRKQLDFFEVQFGFVSREEFLSFVRGGAENSSTPSGVILTFDDGFKDHYDVVFPELQIRDLWGIFYVPTLPFVTGDMLDVHRTQVLLGEHSPKKVLKLTRDVIDEKM